MDKPGLQETQYAFPYHHIPRFPPRFSQERVMYWGYEYLSYLGYVLEKIALMEFDSLIDIGCGDGRFIHELAKRFPSKRLVGVDYLERSLAFARAFTPDAHFATATDERFDAFILTEVMEHINPAEMDSFLDGVCKNMNTNARGVITVPADTIPTHPKHYRHFNEQTLREALAGRFEIESLEFLNAEAFGVAIIKRILANHLFSLSHQGMLNALYRLYIKRYLLATPQTGRRIVAVVRAL